MYTYMVVSVNIIPMHVNGGFRSQSPGLMPSRRGKWALTPEESRDHECATNRITEIIHRPEYDYLF